METKYPDNIAGDIAQDTQDYMSIHKLSVNCKITVLGEACIITYNRLKDLRLLLSMLSQVPEGKELVYLNYKGEITSLPQLLKEQEEQEYLKFLSHVK